MADPTTIENTPHGAYLCRCTVCDETFELNSSNCLGQPLWVFASLCKGFAEQHQGCLTTQERNCEFCGQERLQDGEGGCPDDACEYWEESAAWPGLSSAQRDERRVI